MHDEGRDYMGKCISCTYMDICQASFHIANKASECRLNLYVLHSNPELSIQYLWRHLYTDACASHQPAIVGFPELNEATTNSNRVS